MNANQSTQTNKLGLKRIKHFATASVVSAGLLASSMLMSVQASAVTTSDKASAYSYEILTNTHSAIENFYDNREEAMKSVKASLELIEKIEAKFDENTQMKKQEFVHFMPKLDMSQINDDEVLDILNDKIEADVVHKGEKAHSSSEGWFDYTFAKASLVTVREAMNADHDVEAMSHLKRVFEAVYIAPEFSVFEPSSGGESNES